MDTVAFHTLGCKVNHYESEAMMDLFKDAGYKIVDFDKSADIYIINSCTVTNQAASKSRKLARRARRRNPGSKVVLLGCYSQVSPEEVRGMEEVDIVLGSSGKENIVGLIEEMEEENKSSDKIVPYSDLVDYEDLRVKEVRETTRAYVKIEDGCNQFCNYCIIPYARGPVKSRKQDSVLAEVRQLLDSGVKEIVLTGTHLGAYGLEHNNSDALVELLKQLLNINRKFRIRLSSIEVTEINDRLLELMQGENRLCSHLHLPLQSGSDSILKAMNRPYTAEEFRESVAGVRKVMPEVALTTDVIVGFPGETENKFRESYNFIKDIGFSRLHVFPFSRRKGTPAAGMSDQIPGDIKKQYSRELRRLNRELMLEYQQRFHGEIREVVIEDKRDYETDYLTGVTDNYIRVLIDDEDKYQEQLLKVELTGTYNHENALGKFAEKQEK